MILALGESLALQVDNLVIRAVYLYERSGKFTQEALVNISGVHNGPRVHTSDASFTLDCPNRVMVHFILGKNWNQWSWRWFWCKFQKRSARGPGRPRRKGVTRLPNRAQI